MERSRPRRGSDLTTVAIRRNKSQAVVPTDLVLDTEPPIEIDQVGATTKQDVLTVVEHLASRGMFIRRCSPAKIGTPLEERDLVTGIGKRATCG